MAYRRGTTFHFCGPIAFENQFVTIPPRGVFLILPVLFFKKIFKYLQRGKAPPPPKKPLPPALYLGRFDNWKGQC